MSADCDMDDVLNAMSAEVERLGADYLQCVSERDELRAEVERLRAIVDDAHIRNATEQDESSELRARLLRLAEAWDHNSGELHDSRLAILECARELRALLGGDVTQAPQLATTPNPALVLADTTDESTAVVLYLTDAHSGPGWYSHDEEYPEEGVSGPNDTADAAADDVADAYPRIRIYERQPATTPAPALVVADGPGDVDWLRRQARVTGVHVPTLREVTGRATIVDLAEVVAWLEAFDPYQNSLGVSEWFERMPPALRAIQDRDGELARMRPVVEAALEHKD